jgi:hypothetical protein
MVGDIGSAYLNALMPRGIQDKILMMTSTNRILVTEMERILLKQYGQFTTSEKIVSYL